MKVTFGSKYSAFQVIAPKGTLISYTETPTEVADGVYVIGDDGAISIDDQLTDTLYLSTVGSDYTVTDGKRVAYPLGDTSVIIRANISTIPFKGGAKGGESGGGTHYRGTTTTALTDGSTTNPITIDGESYTAVFGDIVVYSSSEFIFDGTQWSEFGKPFDTTPTSGSANAVTSDGIYKNTAGKKYYSNNTRKGEIFNDYTTNKASSGYSHAEGRNTTASGYASHAEGEGTKAINDDSHAEGQYATASGYASHAEGRNTTASGDASHAEGRFATASGYASHAEGEGTTASGDASHAGGNGTNATQSNMMAIGKYNSPRTGDLFNIGNGTGNNARSNILEVNSTSMNVNGDIQRDGIGIDDYTTTERKIGKWIDGSDLYQRTFDNVELPNNNAWNNSVLGTTGINILKVDGFIKTEFASDPAIYYPLFYFRDTSNYSTYIISDGDLDVYLYIAISSGTITPLTATITIQYTKPVVNNLSNNIQTVSEPNEEPTEGEDMRSEPVEER
jgi:hypothetical protein